MKCMEAGRDSILEAVQGFMVWYGLKNCLFLFLQIKFKELK